MSDPKVIETIKMTVTFYNTGQVKVDGIPNNMKVAINAWCGALQAIHNYFVDAALNGKLTDGVIKKPMVVVPSVKVPMSIN